MKVELETVEYCCWVDDSCNRKVIAFSQLSQLLPKVTLMVSQSLVSSISERRLDVKSFEIYIQAPPPCLDSAAAALVPYLSMCVKVLTI